MYLSHITSNMGHLGSTYVVQSSPKPEFPLQCPGLDQPLGGSSRGCPLLDNPGHWNVLPHGERVLSSSGLGSIPPFPKCSVGLSMPMWNPDTRRGGDEALPWLVKIFRRNRENLQAIYSISASPHKKKRSEQALQTNKVLFFVAVIGWACTNSIFLCVLGSSKIASRKCGLMRERWDLHSNRLSC